MIRQKIRVAPPNSILFISDPDGGVIPEISRGGLRLWATSSCIVVGCLMFADGETDVTLGSALELDPGTAPIFDGALEVPHREVLVSTSERKNFLTVKTPESKTRVRIWTNRIQEPDVVIVGLG